MKETYYKLKDLIASDSRLLRLLLSENEVIRARNRKNGKERDVPVSALYRNNQAFYNNPQSAWDYMVPESLAETLLSRLKEIDKKKDQKIPHHKEPVSGEEDSTRIGPGGIGPNFSEDYSKIRSLNAEDRLGLLAKSRQRLKELAEKKDYDREEQLEVLVETSRDSALINKAAVDEVINLPNDRAKELMQPLVENTNEMIRALLKVMVNNVIHDRVFESLIERSNGTVVQHMTRVFINGVAFLLHYNSLVSSTSIITSIRANFKKNFKKYYQSLLPHIHPEQLSLEQVFAGGMRALSEEELHKMSLGFLVHDVGKVDDIEYHEGEDDYKRDIVERHVKRGYRAIMNKTNYPGEAGLITGYHHEYYGDADGYGYFREFLDQYKEQNPQALIEHCIAFSMEALIDYEALAYFPAKVLEIVDVFDALTDKNRKYRSPLSPEDALDMMRTEFIEKKHKLDPIIFDIFVNYVQSAEN